jgi:fatty-acid desaturase
MCQVRDEAPNLRWKDDNMLLGQGYHTPHGAGKDKYEAMVKWWLAWEIQRTRIKICSSDTLSTMNLTLSPMGLNLSLHNEEPVSSHLSYSTAIYQEK